jgi:hypothetical protein
VPSLCVLCAKLAFGRLEICQVVIKRYRFYLKAGLGSGNISLKEKEFSSGTYTLRAYTNWMRNFGEYSFFYKSFFISNASEADWLVNLKNELSFNNGNEKANVKLLFNNIDKTPYAVQPLRIQVMAGTENFYDQKLQTGVDGGINMDFSIPNKFSTLTIIATNSLKNRRTIFPIALNREENTEVQFLPEGGNLVTGFPAHVGFKAIGENGKGVNISGIIINQDQKQVAEFNSTHCGIGSFDISIKSGNTYTAKVALPGGLIQSYALPEVKTSGTVLKVKNLPESDSVEVSMGATPDINKKPGNYFLIGISRGIVCYAATVSFHDNNFVIKNVPKSAFPNGVAHFILMTTNEKPLNERIVFINHQDFLNIQLSSNKPNYNTRDSICLKLKVTDKDGNPVEGSFSLAVTDDKQVKTDPLNAGNIISDLLLTSDLKGFIEQPFYYFSSKKPDTWFALDNLMLTQGWVGYDLKQNFPFEVETGFKVSGKITNAFNRSLKGTDVLLFSKSPLILIYRIRHL